MKATFIEYPKCSTCKKTKKYLTDKNIDLNVRDIVLDTPNYEELKEIIEKSSKDINNFFNTCGLKYKQLNLKEKLKTLNYEEKLKLLVSDGMLIKRPILIIDNKVLLGFVEISKNY